MNKLFAIISVFVLIVLNADLHAQLIQYGIRTQTDVRNESMPFKNFSVGPEFDINIPVVGFGLSASAMFSLQNLEPRTENVLDGTYEYIYIPFNFKWRIGSKVCRGVIAAGPYMMFPLGSDVKKEALLESNSEASLWGADIQAGIELFGNWRLSVGYRSDAYQSSLEDLLHHAHGFYIDFFYAF